MQPEVRDCIVMVESLKLRVAALEDALAGNIVGFYKEKGDGGSEGQIKYSRVPVDPAPIQPAEPVA